MGEKHLEILFPHEWDLSEEEYTDHWNLGRYAFASARETFDLSIVVPVFNVAPYVERALRSVLDQDGISHQIVIVDDGSTDESLAKVLALLDREKHGHVVVIHQDNRGLSAARNNGLRFALGSYVAFLDSDDFMAPNSYVAPVRMAQLHSLEAVFFRSTIYDERSGSFAPFYDHATWDALLRGRDWVITCAAESPQLLNLEPNANTRIVRRELVSTLNLFYPEGLHFEDPPVHVALLLGSRNIGLLSSSCYCYRINRPGKITDQRSQRRFDLLASMEKTIAAAVSARISPEQGAFLVASLLRITYWCGTMTTLGDRRRYYHSLCQKWKTIPKSWSIYYRRFNRQDLRHLLILWAIEQERAHFLCDLSFARKPPLTLLYFFVSEWRITALAYQIAVYIRHKAVAKLRVRPS
jgi:glycosyltransferase involved in cell wall biosynthesis